MCFDMNRCYCLEYCLPQGGTNSDGQPLGVSFSKKQFLQSHELHLQRERQARWTVAAQAQQAQAQELEALGAQLFATTLLDDSPAHNETTHSTIPQTNPASSDNSTIRLIVDGVQHIGLSPESNTTSTEEFR